MLPERASWPTLLPVPGQDYPQRLNAAIELLDRHLEAGFGARPAVFQDAQCTSYLELSRRVQGVAASLVEMGLQKGDRVLLRLPNSRDFIVCWLAIVRQGGVAVPTLPLLKSREIHSIVDDCRPRLAICQAGLLSALESSPGASAEFQIILAGPAEKRALQLADLEENPHRVSPESTRQEDLATLLYTSGSTGKPKGAGHLQRDILAVADCYSRHILAPTREDVFGGPPSLAFAFGLGGLLIFPLRAGAATLVGDYLLPPALAAAARRVGLTLLFGSPSFFKLLLEIMQEGVRTSLDKVRIAISAGETLPGPLLTRWSKVTGIPLLDGIGTTEMLHIFLSTTTRSAPPNSMGWPVPGYEARVVNDELEEVPAGEIGKLAVRGATGCLYWGLPEEQSRYVQGGWNLTGDLCFQDANGTFYYKCRIDDLIISGGNNVDPLEVENALLQLDEVAECGVVGREDPHLGQVPVAVVVPALASLREQDLLKAIHRQLNDQLASYKIPRRVEIVDRLPRTATGKLRRSALRSSR